MQENQKFIVHLTENELRQLFSEEIKRHHSELASAEPKDNLLEFFVRKDLLKIFKISRNTISEWVKYEGFPKPIQIGKPDLWLKADVIAFIEKKKKETKF